MTASTSRQPVKLGPVGRRVAERLKAIRSGDENSPGLSLRALEKTLKEIGHPISNDGLSKIETGKRKVDVDDLVALAVALDVSPLTLLLPVDIGKDGAVPLTEKRSVDAETAWEWMRVNKPLETPPGDDGEAQWKQQLRNLPAWLQRITASTPFMRRFINDKSAELERLRKAVGDA